MGADHSIFTLRSLPLVNSHIQMPCCVLKRFVDERHFLYYYDFDSKQIKRGTPKSVDTQQGYYSDDVEAFLSDEVETKLGELIKSLDDENYDFISKLKDDYKEIAFNYLYALIARSKSYISMEKQFSVMNQFTDFFVDYKGGIVALGILAAQNTELLKERFSVAFMINSTNEEFVLPANGTIKYKSHIICPVTSKRAIVFEPLITDSCRVSLYEINNIHEMHEINLSAVAQEANQNNKFVVSKSRNLLTRLIYDLGLKLETYLYK